MTEQPEGKAVSGWMANVAAGVTISIIVGSLAAAVGGLMAIERLTVRVESIERAPPSQSLTRLEEKVEQLSDTVKEVRDEVKALRAPAVRPR
jgi:hypothetical protein